MKTLAKKIDEVLEQHDENCSYKEFAEAVSHVLKESYGKHLYKKFINKIEDNLKK